MKSQSDKKYKSSDSSFITYIPKKIQKVSKYFKVLKKYFTSFYFAIALLSEVGSPTSTAIAKLS
ncbi:13619_t:CDS:1, partial [Gigaspora margarita]